MGEWIGEKLELFVTFPYRLKQDVHGQRGSYVCFGAGKTSKMTPVTVHLDRALAVMVFSHAIHEPF